MAGYVALYPGRPGARYVDLLAHEADRAARVHLYPGRMDACYVDGERVWAGDVYGGWITADIAGPFKGGTATFGW